MFGASFDTPEENKAFADAQNFGFRLLSDGDRTIGAQYEVTREPGEQYADFAQRVAYLIDPDGMIRKAYAVSDVKTFAADVLADLAALRARGNAVNGTTQHRHGLWMHDHHHHGPHRHARLPFRSAAEAGHDHDDHDHDDHDHDDHEHDDHEHAHTHGRIDPSIVRSRDGVRAVVWSLAILGATAALQAVVFMTSRSVALLADLIHNGGDALTAIPLGIAFWLRSDRGERWAGYAVVLTIFASAMVAAFEAVDRLLHPRDLTHLPVLAIAGVVGFIGNEIAAQVRLRAGGRLNSPALIADGHHARVDGYVSLGVVIAAVLVAVGLPRADPVVGLAITGLILRITWQAWRTIRAGPAH